METKMDNNQAEILIKVLESIDARIGNIGTQLENLVKLGNEAALDIRALRITSAENPATPAPQPTIKQPAAIRPDEALSNVRVTILDGAKHYWKDQTSGVVRACFYPATRVVEGGREIFVKLAVRQNTSAADAPSCDRFNPGDKLFVSGRLKTNEWQGKKRTTLWADDVTSADDNIPAPATPADDTDDIPF